MTIDKLRGHFSCFFAYLIFGFNIIITKDITNLNLISPVSLFTLRALGAALLFWVVSLFVPYEKVPLKDLGKIFIASMFGLFLTQISFLKGITMATPFDTSMITTLSPIFTMFIAAIALKEPITLKKAGGVVLSFAGILFLIYNSFYSSGNLMQTKPLGFVLLILNGLSFSLYLGIFRPLIAKYSVVTFMKWMFLFSLLPALPFSGKELINLEYALIPNNYIISLLYLIIMATFIAYFLIPIGQKSLRPTVVSLYSYLQPIIASVTSIIIGMDILSWQKVIAATAVVSGVILVNKSRAANTILDKK